MMSETTLRRLADGSVLVGSDPQRRAWAVSAGNTRWVFLDGEVYEISSGAARVRSRGGHHESLMAPMPATVVKINVAVGDAVTRGDTLIVLEAMKMELPVRALSDGKVTAINCREGELVQPEVSLIELDD